MSSALRSPKLRRVIAAYTINRLGTWFGLVALLLAVFDHTESAGAIAALLFAGQALPAFFVPALVARVEASKRGGELSGLYLFEAAATSGLALLLWNFSLAPVLVLVALDGIAALAAQALLRAEVARIARADAHTIAGRSVEPGSPSPSPEELGHEAERKANAALNLAFSATFILGPIIAAAVVAGAGAPAALFIDAGSFVLCALLLIDLHPHVEEAAGDSVRARLRAAWQYVRDTPPLLPLLVAETFAFVFFESAAPIEVTFAKATLDVGDRGFGLLLTTWGAGAVLGSLLFARALRCPLGALLSIGTLAVGLGYIGFALSSSLAAACVAALLGGIGNGVELPSLVSLVQRITPPSLHGRLMGAIESLGSVGVAIGLPLGGALVALTSPRVAFVIVGLGAAATAAAVFRLAPRGVASGSSEGEPGASATAQPEVAGAPAREHVPPNPAAT